MSLPSEPTEMPPQWPMHTQWLSPIQPHPRGICSLLALHVCSSRTALQKGRLTREVSLGTQASRCVRLAGGEATDAFFQQGCRVILGIIV